MTTTPPDQTENSPADGSSSELARIAEALERIAYAADVLVGPLAKLGQHLGPVLDEFAPDLAAALGAELLADREADAAG